MNPLRQKLSPYYREAERWLINGPRERPKIEQRREQILQSSPPTISDGMPRGSDISNPTANKAIALEELDHDWRWCCLVAQVEGELAGMQSGEMVRLLDLKRVYGRGARGRRSLQMIATKMHYSSRHVADLWKDVIYYTIIRAIEAGMIKKQPFINYSM